MNNRRYDRLIPPPQERLVLPRLVHQTYPGWPLPAVLRDNVSELHASNPGWTHCFYDNQGVERFIHESYGLRMLSYYRRIDPRYGAARADLFRYLVTYRLGGIYLDIKSRFCRPIDEVLTGDETYVISRWRNRRGQRHEGFGLHRDIAHIEGGELQQWHIIAAAGHPFLRAVIRAVLAAIDGYRPWRQGTGKIGVLRTTGPILYTLAITPLLERYPYTAIGDESQLSLQYSVMPGEAHKRLFNSHYSAGLAPVVTPHGAQRLTAGLFTSALVVKRHLAHRLGKISER
jgi:hypothetical protein